MAEYKQERLHRRAEEGEHAKQAREESCADILDCSIVKETHWLNAYLHQGGLFFSPGLFVSNITEKLSTDHNEFFDR